MDGVSMVKRIVACVMFAGALLSQAGHAQTPALSPPEQGMATQQQKQQQVQPLNNQPVWSEVRTGLPQYTSVQGRETDILIQPQGQTWRALRVPIAFWGGLLFALAVGCLAAFYLYKGTITAHETPGEPIIERFSPLDRYAHWLLAIVWVALAITGLILSLGKSVVLPLIGHTLFSWLADLSKGIHNFSGPILIVAIPFLFVRFVRDNGIGIEDVKRFLNLMGYFKDQEYPSDRFNAGEKLVFWVLLVLLSSVLLFSGLVMLFPNFNQLRSTMQVANVIHMIAAYLAIALACVHIYLGTIGMSGAYRAMRDGYVTASWAKHHHLRWYERVKAGRARQHFVEPGTQHDDVQQPVQRRPA